MGEGGLVQDFEDVAGSPSDEVPVEISYNIIRQVSAQLYTNPRKAIEELVCNSYDAGAEECYVKVPEDSSDFLGVLDDGVSMDGDGIRDLWKVATSPKQKMEERGEPRVAHGRAQIGKFGVGKLAAYSLGKRLTHVATTDGITRVISVAEEEIRDRGDDGSPMFEVYSLDHEEARDIVEPYLGDLPNPWERGWTSWTLAIVEDIDEESLEENLNFGVLKRMIKTALPLSSNFQIYLQDDEISRREIPDSKIDTKIEVTDEEFRDTLEQSLKAFWKERLGLEDDSEVPSKYYECEVEKRSHPEDLSTEVHALEVPELGSVIGNGVITKTPLTTEKRQTRGYQDNGLAIRVKGKLINPEEPLFGLSQRSHKYWVRFFGDLEIPGLDDVLLVQRNEVREDKVQTPLARHVAKTLFNYCRQEADLEEEEFQPESFGNRLNLFSSIGTSQAVRGLGEGLYPPEGLESVEVQFATFDDSDRAADYDAEDSTIYVNEEHPIINVLDELPSTNRRKFRNLLAEVLAGQLMSCGYLHYNGVGSELLDESRDVTDLALRSAANYIRDEVDYLQSELHEASFEGDDVFEKAIVDALSHMRLVARREGGSDEPDGIIEIPRAGSSNLRISVEAKGSKGPVDHDDVNLSAVERHRDESDCDHAVIVAREFQLDGLGDKDSALIREIRKRQKEADEADEDDETISLLTLDALKKLLELQAERRMTWNQTIRVLRNEKHPEEQIEHVEEVWKDAPKQGVMRDILETAESIQDSDDVNYPSVGALTAEEKVKQHGLENQEVIEIIGAIEATTGYIFIRDTSLYEFELLRDTDTILEAFAARRS